MPKKYIVGLDAGHGETAAWIVPITASASMEAGGSSARLNASNNTNERARHSVIYKLPNGEFSLRASTGCALIGKMKTRVSELRTNSERFRAYSSYIHLIVEELVRQNPILTLNDPADGKPNFHICMAAPTKWNDQDKNEYLQFFNEAVADLGISFEWIINESDAAYFSFHSDVKPSDVVLIIDYGSSTIDYTVMHNGKKISKDEWSNSQLGAGRIEDAMVNSFRNKDNDGFQRSMSGHINLLNKLGLTHIDVEEYLNYKCRFFKEQHYIGNDPDFVEINYHLGTIADYDYMMEFQQCRFVHAFKLSEVIADYCNAVKTDIEDLQAKIKNATGKNVTKVILSGGACIMGWVPSLVKEIFPDAEILLDYYPGFVVAKGIALYARAQQKALEDLLDEIRKADFVSAYKTADTQATKDAIKDLSGAAISDIRTLPTCIKMVDRFCDYINSLDDSNYQYRSLLKSKLSEYVTKTACTALANAFQRHFNWKLDSSGISISVDAQCLSWDKANFVHDVSGRTINMAGPVAKCVMDAIDNILGRHISFYTSTNWNEKERTKTERDYIANELVSEVLGSGKFDGITYPDGFVDNQANAIKDQALKYAEDIFYSNQLFRTTFS